MALFQIPLPRSDKPTALKAHPEPRAEWYIRLGRILRRKRVAYARIPAVHAYRVYLREVARMYEVARIHNVPVPDMPEIPGVPSLSATAGRAWVACKANMGPLKEPVRPAPAEPTGAVTA